MNVWINFFSGLYSRIHQNHTHWFYTRSCIGIFFVFVSENLSHWFRICFTLLRAKGTHLLFSHIKPSRSVEEILIRLLPISHCNASIFAQLLKNLRTARITFSHKHTLPTRGKRRKFFSFTRRNYSKICGKTSNALDRVSVASLPRCVIAAFPRFLTFRALPN